MLLNARAIATTSQNSPAAGAAAAAAPAALAEALHTATLAACAADAAAKKESVSGHCPVPMWLEQCRHTITTLTVCQLHYLLTAFTRTITQLTFSDHHLPARPICCAPTGQAASCN